MFPVHFDQPLDNVVIGLPFVTHGLQIVSRSDQYLDGGAFTPILRSHTLLYALCVFKFTYTFTPPP